MTFDFSRADFEALEADLEAVGPEGSSLEPGRGMTAALADQPTPGLDPFALIERLARQLALAHGEDPDEQPHPLRHPRWRYHCGRAKTLLAISAAVRQALAAVLGPAWGQGR